MSNSDEVDHVKIKMFQQSDIVLQEKSTGDSNEDTSKIDATSNQQIQQSPDEVSVSNTSVKRWVQFEDEDSETSKSNNIPQLENVDLSDQTKSSLTSTTPAAVLTTESVHININNKTVNHPLSQTTLLTTPAVIDIPNTNNSNPGLRTIELSTGRVREGFANGDIIVTLLPVNTRWPWITPAQFRPELVPEELMAQGLTLTVEEYVHALETLVNDFRFTLYNVCYKRVLCVWIFFAFSVLLGLLFSGLKGIALFSLGVGWLFLNAAAIFLCMWVKLRLARGLERCLASVNKQLLRHKIILVLDDRGKISCHKVNLCFMYFDPIQCVNYLNEFIERNEQNGTSIEQGWESRLDVSAADIVIQGNNPTRVSRKQARGQELFLRYLQRWGKEFLRRRLDWIVEESGIHEMPRHLQSSMCHCQFIEEILHNKPKKDSCVCCSKCNDWINRHGERGTLLLLRYTSRWSNEVMRGLADVSIIEPARHCASFICPCQYIERHLSCKPRGKLKYFKMCYWVTESERYD